MEQSYPTKEDIAKVLTETITFTGQIGVLNIYHTINRLHDMFHKKEEKEPELTDTPKNQLSMF